MKLQLLQNKLPKLPKQKKSPIHSIYMLGKLIISKLPISYLSYLNRKNSFQVRLVSTGKYKVSNKTLINKGFGKIGKIFCILLILQNTLSCQNSTDLETNDDKKLEQKKDTQSKRLKPTLSIYDGTEIPIDPPIIIPSDEIAYIRYNIQDDEFSINGGPWYSNPYATHDCDSDFICAIGNTGPCNPVFHSGTVKFTSVQSMSVPAGINLNYSLGSTSDVINFSNTNCTYFLNTDIMHFKVTYIPW